MHLIAAIPNALFLEYALSNSPLNVDLFPGAVPVADGMAGITDAPGLGVTINEEVLAKYSIN